MADDIDPLIFSIFMEEYGEILEGLDVTLAAWMADDSDDSALAEIQRQLHTLKGAARMAGVESLGDYCHTLETDIEQFREDDGAEDTSSLRTMLDAAVEPLSRAREQLQDDPAATLQFPKANETAGAAVFDAGTLATPTATPAAEPSSSAAAAVPAEERRGEVDPMIFGIFMEEYGEILESLDSTLARWIADDSDDSALAEIQRQLHTLKGAARMAGVESLGDYCHDMETDIERFREGEGDDDPANLRHMLDAAVEPLNTARQRLSDDPLAPLSFPEKGGSSSATATDTQTTAVPPPAVAAAIPAAKPAQTTAAKPPQKPAAKQGQTIRVDAAGLDDLISQSTELASDAAGIAADAEALRSTSAAMDSSLERLSDLQRLLEAEARMLAHLDTDGEASDQQRIGAQRSSELLADISRAWREIAEDLGRGKRRIADGVSHLADNLTQQQRNQSAMRDGLLATRTVPLSWLEPRLQRLLRQTASELGKSVRLVLDNPDGELDRQLLERIAGPMEHLLRNGIDHGVEGPEKRRAAGKPEQGELRLAVDSDGSRVLLRLRDDGAGINTAKLIEKARSNGLIGPTDTLPEKDALRLIFHAGLSTAESVSQVSGRGVGMDAVQSEIESLGGSIDIDSELGKGSCFTLSLPYSLSMSELLLLESRGHSLALPAARVNAVLPLDEALLRRLAEGQGRISELGREWQTMDLGAALKLQPLPGAGHDPQLILINAGDRSLALRADVLRGTRALPVRPVPPTLRGVPVLMGVSVIGEGLPLLVLDPARLPEADTASSDIADTGAVGLSRSVDVLVVDDSESARQRVLGDLAESRWRVEAIDSAAACLDWFAGGSDKPKVVLVDADMPGMDGFQLIQRLRKRGLFDGPVVVMSSSRHPRLTDRARVLGARRFLLKPCRRQTLIDCVDRSLEFVEKQA